MCTSYFFTCTEKCPCVRRILVGSRAVEWETVSSTLTFSRPRNIYRWSINFKRHSAPLDCSRNATFEPIKFDPFHVCPYFYNAWFYVRVLCWRHGKTKENSIFYVHAFFIFFNTSKQRSATHMLVSNPSTRLKQHFSFNHDPRHHNNSVIV